MMFSSDSAAARTRASAACTRALSREERHAATSAIISFSTAGSTTRMLPGTASGLSSDSVYEFTPTTTCSPPSIRRVRVAMERTRRPLSSSTELNAPPRDNTSSNSAHAASRSSAVRASMTFDPSKMSSYSRRSDSNASTCCIRNDHCWSHGRGKPRASFHAGNCTLRARAFFESVTASISRTMR